MNPNEKFKLLIGKYLVCITLGVTGIVGGVLLIMFFFCLIGILAGEPGILSMTIRSFVGTVVCAVLAALCAAWREVCGCLKPEKECDPR